MNVAKQQLAINHFWPVAAVGWWDGGKLSAVFCYMQNVVEARKSFFHLVQVAVCVIFLALGFFFYKSKSAQQERK